MLTIRREQMDAFVRNALAEFEARLRKHLEALLPETPRPEIEADVRASIALCRDAGLTREKDMARFAEIVCRHLGGYPARGLPREALSNLYVFGRDPAVKLDHFEEWARRRGPADGA
jgi:hypothetical protein